MLFRMRLLKFYKEIEYDEDIYVTTANKILNGTLPWEYVNKIEKLRLKHEEEKKKKWQEIKNKQATKRGLQVRAIVNKFKR
jgi:hypothetical protein